MMTFYSNMSDSDLDVQEKHAFLRTVILKKYFEFRLKIGQLILNFF